MTRAVMALTILVISALSIPASAAPEDVANQIAARMMSPYCDGVTLHDCPSREAANLRERIARWAEQGLTTAQIEAELEQEFGENIWATPPASGMGLLAWLLPALATVAGGLVAWRYLRRWAVIRQRSEGYDPDVHITDEDRRRLDNELAKLRGHA